MNIFQDVCNHDMILFNIQLDIGKINNLARTNISKLKEITVKLGKFKDSIIELKSKVHNGSNVKNENKGQKNKIEKDNVSKK